MGDAIGRAVKRLRVRPAGQRVLILLTDGVSNAGQLDPAKAAELARDNGVRVHTIAFGGEGGDMSVFGFRMPMPGGGDGMDEAALERIADITGGRTFSARDTAELAGISADIDRLAPGERTGGSGGTGTERERKSGWEGKRG